MVDLIFVRRLPRNALPTTPSAEDRFLAVTAHSLPTVKGRKGRFDPFAAPSAEWPLFAQGLNRSRGRGGERPGEHAMG